MQFYFSDDRRIGTDGNITWTWTIVLVVPTTTKDYSLQLSLQLPTPTILFNTYKNHIYTTYIHILTCRLTTFFISINFMYSNLATKQPFNEIWTKQIYLYRFACQMKEIHVRLSHINPVYSSFTHLWAVEMLVPEPLQQKCIDYWKVVGMMAPYPTLD